MLLQVHHVDHLPPQGPLLPTSQSESATSGEAGIAEKDACRPTLHNNAV